MHAEQEAICTPLAQHHLPSHPAYQQKLLKPQRPQQIYEKFSLLCSLFTACRHTNTLQGCIGYTKHGRDSRFFALNEMLRSRGLSARTSSPRRSSASALSGSALRIAFARYALSAQAGRRAQKLAIITPTLNIFVYEMLSHCIKVHQHTYT